MLLYLPEPDKLPSLYIEQATQCIAQNVTEQRSAVTLDNASVCFDRVCLEKRSVKEAVNKRPTYSQDIWGYICCSAEKICACRSARVKLKILRACRWISVSTELEVLYLFCRNWFYIGANCYYYCYNSSSNSSSKSRSCCSIVWMPVSSDCRNWHVNAMFQNPECKSSSSELFKLVASAGPSTMTYWGSEETGCSSCSGWSPWLAALPERRVQAPYQGRASWDWGVWFQQPSCRGLDRNLEAGKRWPWDHRVRLSLWMKHREQRVPPEANLWLQPMVLCSIKRFFSDTALPTMDYTVIHE